MAAGYDGPLSLEVFNDVFRQAEAGPTAVDAHRSLLMLQEAAGIATLPKRVVPTGVAFAELVTPDAEPVGALLGALGFARTARHRSKPVDLWQQGEARVLVNTGLGLRGATAPSSPRSDWSHRTRPAPSAAPRRCSRRCCRGAGPPRTRRWTRWQRPTGRNSSSVRRTAPNSPAGPGTSGPWNTRRPCGHVHRVDHLALTQPWHQFDEAALFHRTVLGLHASDSVDVADPYGLFRSRPVTNEGGTVRIALSVGPAPTDDTARAQHIALATDDVVAAARAFPRGRSGCWPSRRTTTTTWPHGSSSPTASWRRTANSVSSTTATKRTASSVTATPRPSAASSSNSSSGTAGTRVTARRTRPCALPPSTSNDRPGKRSYWRLTVRVTPVTTVVARIQPVMTRTYDSHCDPPSGA